MNSFAFELLHVINLLLMFFERERIFTVSSRLEVEMIFFFNLHTLALNLAMTQTVFCARVALWSCASRATSYQPRSAGPTAYRGGGGAERADGGRAGTPLQAGPPPRALGLGRRGAGEADTRHLVDGSEEPISGHALEVPARNESRHRQSTFSPFSRKPCRRLIFAEHCRADLPGARHRSVILPKGFIQLHSAPLSLGEVCLPQKPNHSCLCTTHLHEKRKHKLEPGSGDSSD